ncbi:MAG TPA: T9SS type A sorting domain-containing protein [Ignavibacteriaceae bacterium]|nr:T9SS type A sorting domain-containing protein [Ignavibacteriaceae bacterium]
MKSITYFVLFCVVIYAQVSFGQAHYFNKYDGIPIIAHTNLTSEQLVSKPSSFQKMVELGIFGFYATDLNPTRYEAIKSSGLKLFPYQHSWTPEDTNDVNPQPFVAHYTNGVYSIWLAGGNGNGEYGNIKIDYNPSLAELSQSGTGIITKANASAGHLLEGPYYAQAILSKVYGQVVEYTADFRMKIERIEPVENLPIDYENDVLCSLQVVATRISQDWDGGQITQYDTLKYGKKILVKDFKSANGIMQWDTWLKMSTGLYTLVGLNQEKQGFFGESIETASRFSTEFMQYKVKWNGLPYLKLSLDTIIISDEVGEKLFSDPDARYDILYAVSHYSDTNYVLGWHGINEPGSIDNYLCFRKVSEIIHEQYPKLEVFTSLAGASNGRFTWKEFYKGVNHPSIYPHYEFIKRSGLNYLSINLYNYNYPYIPPPGSGGYVADQNYRELNAQYVADSNLVKLVDADIPISYSTQSGRFYDWRFDKNTLSWKNLMYNHINPTFEEMNYHINLGLLFGAKELTCDPIFTIWDTNANQYHREGLIDYESTSTPLTSLGIHFRDIINPRLSGLFGKKLQQLNAVDQYTDKTTGQINNLSYIKSISTSGCSEEASNSIIDLGIFSETAFPEIKYFMICNRYYSECSEFEVQLSGLTPYQNWFVTDYVDTCRKELSPVGEYWRFYDTISRGDARLYGVRSTVRYGGEIDYDETVTSETLTENDLTINSGKTLTIMGTYDCYKNIIVSSGGKLDIRPGSTLNFHNGSKIVVNGLFTANGKSDTLINIDFQSVSGNPLNGILFGNSSSGNIDYCTIENGYYGVTASSCSLIIRNSEIKNCNIGIYMYNTSYYGNDTEINGCNIHDNTYSGIHLNNASPLITNNAISGSIDGVRCLDNSDALLGKGGVEGYNDINDVWCGIYVFSSDPKLGSFDEKHQAEIGGYNSIVGEDYHAFVEMYSEVIAHLNWWGSPNPQAGKFIQEDGGAIDYNYFLESSPFGEIQTPEEGGEELLVKGKTGQIPLEGLTTREKYRVAARCYLNRDKAGARMLCNSILDEEGENRMKYPALRLLVRCIDEDSVRTNVIGKINNTLLTTAQTDYNAYLEMTLADIVKSSYLTSLDGIMTKYRNTAYKPLILFRKFSYLYFEEENRDSARVIAEMMESQYPDHELTKSAKMMFGVTTLKKETEETSTIPKEYKLYQNYPNPFNPVTTIKYQLPANSKVTLTIYDILGKEVTKLVDKEQEAGKYEVEFNSGKLASGVYVYRIKAGEFMMSKKMILVK